MHFILRSDKGVIKRSSQLLRSTLDVFDVVHHFACAKRTNACPKEKWHQSSSTKIRLQCTHMLFFSNHITCHNTQAMQVLLSHSNIFVAEENALSQQLWSLGLTDFFYCLTMPPTGIFFAGGHYSWGAQAITITTSESIWTQWPSLMDVWWWTTTYMSSMSLMMYNMATMAISIPFQYVH